MFGEFKSPGMIGVGEVAEGGYGGGGGGGVGEGEGKRGVGPWSRELQ